MDEHNVLLERIPSLPDVQSVWALLLHCANARANYALRVIRPELARHFAQAHDAGLWRCLCAILRVIEDQCDALAKDAASLPLSVGGLGLRSAVRTSSSAHWASWADSLPMVRERHPGVADMIVDALESKDPVTPILSTVVEAARAVQVGNFEPPSWASLSHGAHPPALVADEFEPRCSRRGWHEAASRTEMVHRDGPGSGLAFSAVPASVALRIDSHHFRLLLLRRLRLPLPPVSRVMADFGQNRLWPKPTLAKTNLICCVLSVSRRYLFHGKSGVSCVGVGFKVWFGPPFLWTSLPLDRPQFRSFFPSPAAKFVLFFPLWVSSR